MQPHSITKSRKLQAAAILLVAALILTIISIAQASPQLSISDGTKVSIAPVAPVWEKTFGGTDDDRTFCALPVEDGFLVVGSTQSLSDSIAGWVLRLDSAGNPVWNRTFLEDAGTEIRYAANLTDGFLLVGNVFHSLGVTDGWVAKIDFEGNLQWQTTLGGEKTDKLFSGTAVPDGYVAFGVTYSYSSGGAGWIVKLDSGGNPVWNNIYGQNADTTLRSGIYKADDSYLAAGYTDHSGEGNFDFCLYNVASNGTLIWSRTYGGAESEKAYSITAAPGGFILAGDAQSPQTSSDAWIVKVDFEGNQIWNKIIGGADADSAAYITPAKDDGFLAAGFTFSFGAGQRDFWLFKISDGGQVMFSCTYGTEAFEEAYAVIDAGGDQYVMAGWADPAGQSDLIGKALYDWRIVKLDAGGNTQNQPFFIYTAIISAGLAVALILLSYQKQNKV